MKRLLTFIDKLSEYSCKTFAWLIVVLVGALFYEVVARYVFNRPTMWSYDITYMLYGALFIMASAYALALDRHVRIDVFYRLFSPRWKGIVDAALYIVIFFPVVGILLMKGVDYAAHSWAIREVSSAGAWRPPLYPLKSLFPVAMFFLLLQGLAQFVRSLQLAKGGE